MQELEKKMQNENFDVEVQYCDPNDCSHDCAVAPGGVTHILHLICKIELN